MTRRPLWSPGQRLVGLISQDARAEGIRQKWVSPLPEKAVFLTNSVASDLLKWLTVAGFPPANPMVPLFIAPPLRMGSGMPGRKRLRGNKNAGRRAQ